MTNQQTDHQQADPPHRLEGTAKSDWALDPGVIFLNHGSFGARPHCVLEAQTAWRSRMEAEPLEFLDRQGPELLAHLKKVTGRFVGADPDDLAFVSNATEAVNAVLRSLDLGPGDEVLTTNHAYPGIRNTLIHITAQRGARLTQVPVPVPLAGPRQVVQAVEAAITAQSRLLVIDHITSFTALVFPVREIIAICRERGVEVLVDGAHAPGMIDLDIAGLDATYYAANLHKWTCAPISAAVLWVTPDNQSTIHPLIISNLYGEGFDREFQWQGTRDVTACLAAEEAIAFGDRIGWDRIRLHNHQMATWVQQMLCDRWNVEPISPRDGSMLGSMASIPLPQAICERFQNRDAIKSHLFREHRIEVPVTEWMGMFLIRPCCQIYNRPAEYESLADAISAMSC